MPPVHYTQEELAQFYEQAPGPIWYVLSDTSENWRGSWNGKDAVKKVNEVAYVHRSQKRNRLWRYELLTQQEFNGMEGDGFLCLEEEYEDEEEEGEEA